MEYWHNITRKVEKVICIKDDFGLNEEIIRKIVAEIKDSVSQLMGDNVEDIILFGSCARGDYDKDSDIDIAILTKTGREENAAYRMELAEIATDIAMEYFTVVNFLCIPYREYIEKKSWYALYKNISNDGIAI